ncbi:MAG TPA: saccharopine dehydrogenase NADP-binding domain-containing protein, partial [Bryobacteraceae bacterium]|nr:saccharopine dehydrogenase NADP-binding domain-containing protein [Bryobacteraceae bacterium]
MRSESNLLIYGATGYSGRLIVQRALDRALRPIIAGRDPRAIASMATEYGLEWRTAEVDDPVSLRAMTGRAAVLINAAGPFTATAAPLIEACIETGTHYLDITGEAGTIEATSEWNDAALREGIMLMPAAGFEVVASDCLAAHVARRLPGATALKIGFDKSQATSRGSL